MNRATLIQVQTKVLLKKFLASEFSFLDSKLVRVHTVLRCSFQGTLPFPCQTLPTTTHKGFWLVQSLKNKHGGKSSGDLKTEVEHTSHSASVESSSASLESLWWSSSGRIASVTWRGTLAKYHPKVSKPGWLWSELTFDEITKNTVCIKLWLHASNEKQSTGNRAGLGLRHRKAYSSLLFCTTKFPGVEGRNGNAVICWRVLVFPCTEQILSTERGKTGRVEYPPRSRNSDDVNVNHNIHSCPATPAPTPLPANRTFPPARRGSPGFAHESSFPT